ncbi:hypothetical protein [Flavobacterium maritimum]|uniref:hypothetical protein n=1 Tax=Flavobacterium maritimum TaxID=3149042 RepID=UPI0032B5C728
MNSVNKSIFVFGLYSLSMGIVLLFFANLVLPIVGFRISKEPWLHLLGFVLICSSYYYLRSAINGNIDFARYTMHTRFCAPLVIIFLIVTDKADWHFLSFGIVDGLGGIWTWIELKKINFKS